MTEQHTNEPPFREVPGAVDLARYFWHEVVLVDREGPHRLGNYHGCDGINLWREGSDYCYLWVEATVDHDMWVSFLLDVRTKIGGIETRDYVFLDAGAGDLFEVEWRNKPIRSDAPTDDHIDRLREGLLWFTNRVIHGVERRNPSALGSNDG